MNHSTVVAIVDDDPAPRRGLVRLLNAAGYETRDFASADELLRDLDAGGLTFGCLILDARLPGRPLLEFQGELAARGIKMPCIVVTVDDSSETRQMAREMNAVGFFCKPVDGMALLDAIRWAVPEATSVSSQELVCHPAHVRSAQALTRGELAAGRDREGGVKPEN